MDLFFRGRIGEPAKLVKSDNHNKGDVIPMKPDNSIIIEAIHDAKGNISTIAQRLGVSRPTVYSWIEQDGALQTELTHAREQICDMAEAVLIQHLERGNLRAATFTLNYFGRQRSQAKNEPEFVPISSVDIQRLIDSVPEFPPEEEEINAAAVA